ncbi:HET-domain-containing protein [Acephala macrosclerotiorum]|nr:HET-domain-containing protein [Acephala macrosclerotiorum]
MPASLHLRGEIEIKIFHADATSSPDYEALSYVWGPSDLTHEVYIRTTVNDDVSLRGLFGRLSFLETRGQHQRLSITRNLFTALSYMRLLDKSRVLWIDAICINQVDEDEKSREVRKIGDIYGHARRVVVWLGEGREDSSLAITTLKAIGESIQFFDDGRAEWAVKSGSEAHQLESELSNPRAARAKVLIWIAIRNFFNVPWFTRLWVFQEVGRAHDAIFVVGNEYIQWQVLRGAFKWIRYQDRRSTLPTQAIRILDEVTTEKAQPIFKHFTVLKNSGDILLTDLIDWTKRLRCYDPRDRIYALLSLFDRCEAEKIVPNYKNTVEQVYTEVILNHIEFTERLRIFDICDFAKADSKLRLPSWVPDLSVPNPIEWNGHWNAAGRSASESRYEKANGTLLVKGRHVCVINYVATPIPISSSLADILAICHAWEPPSDYETGYITGGSLTDAFVSTLFLSCCLGSPQLADRPEMLSLNSMKAAYASLVVEDTISAEHQLYAASLGSILPGRTFFTTEEGYIGLCPSSARPGDQICVALGSWNPILLRPVPKREGQYYQVGGTCFVYGLMNGEGILGPLPPDWTYSWMELRGHIIHVFMNPNHKTTQFDPRGGPLPRGWKLCYYGPEKHLKLGDEIGPDGSFRKQRFENQYTGEVTRSDPRLTSENLRKMGIKLQDIILV